MRRLREILICLITFVPLPVEISAQKKAELVGLWQIHSPEIASEYDDVYRFFPNGTFEFEYSGYRWSGRRIVSFSGTYRLHGDSIYFRIETTREILGGNIGWDGPPNTLGWIVQDGKEQTVNQISPKEIGLEIYENLDTVPPWIKIETQKFYLINKDPH